MMILGIHICPLEVAVVIDLARIALAVRWRMLMARGVL